MKKRLVSVICMTLVLCLVTAIVPFQSAQAAGTPTVTVEKVNIASDDTKASVNISISNNPGIVSMRLYLSYDKEALTLTSITDGGILGVENSNGIYSSYPYVLSWANDTARKNFTENGVIATLNFDVKAGATAGEHAVTVAYDNANDDIINFGLESVDFTVVNGGVTIAGTPVVRKNASFTDRGCSLNLDDLISINYYCYVNGDYTQEYIEKNGGIIVWAEDGISQDSMTVENAQNSDKAYIVEGLVKNGSEYTQVTEGIVPKEYGKTFNLRFFIKLNDGTYAYGPMKPFGVFIYCDAVKASTRIGTEMKTLAQTIYDYGVAAKAYFDSKNK